MSKLVAKCNLSVRELQHHAEFTPDGNAAVYLVDEYPITKHPKCWTVFAINSEGTRIDLGMFVINRGTPSIVRGSGRHPATRETVNSILSQLPNWI